MCHKETVMKIKKKYTVVLPDDNECKMHKNKCDYKTNKKEYTLENIFILMFVLFIISVKIFHEPWFDESQAWLIARDSDIFELIWHVMRYEGHTPIWHLLLYIPANIGVPFEIGIKTVNFIFITMAVIIIVKKSPFSLIIRLMLPFTYFIFYQYGVISRSYSLFTFILFLIAYKFSIRNKKPIVFSLLLAILGGIMAYGILIAFGIAVAWFIEIVMKYYEKVSKLSRLPILLIRDKRLYALIFLAFINVFYIAILWPMPDRHTPPLDYQVNIIDRIYRLLLAPAGAAVINDSEFWVSSVVLLFFLFFIGMFVISAFIIWNMNKGMSYYVILPYMCVTLFMTFVYFSIHHTGIYTLLGLFGIWISIEGERVFKTPAWFNRIYINISNTTKNKIIYKRFIKLVFIGILSIQVYWSIVASVNDIMLPYAPYRKLEAFIKEKGITQRRIFDYYSVSNNKNTYFTKNLAVLSYFPTNIFYNHNPDKDISYATHRKLNHKELTQYLKGLPKPEFIIGSNYPLSFYKSVFNPNDYIPVEYFEGYYMWKDWKRHDSITLYIRKDLICQFPHLKAQKDMPSLKMENKNEG